MTRRLNLYIFTFELVTRSWKLKVSLRVTNSKIKVLFFYFLVTNSKLKNKELHFELLTRSRKIKKFTSSY